LTDASAPPLAELLERDHRRLDDLFGAFLAAGDREGAARAIREFDEALRRHTRLEEEFLFPRARGEKLVPSDAETERDRLIRELTLEHVQIRELSGMIVRQLGDEGDPRAVPGLAASLARRWDAHTSREERDGYPAALAELDANSASALAGKLGGLDQRAR
jgi:hypothetical protein